MTEFASPAATATGRLTLAWDFSSSPEVTQYRVYFGAASRQYTNWVVAARTNSVTITGLTPGRTYYFAATAITGSGAESPYSQEIKYVIPTASRPVLQLSGYPKGQVLISGRGSAGRSYDLLASRNLTTWSSLGTVTLDALGRFDFADTTAGGMASRFYRLRETTAQPLGTIALLGLTEAREPLLGGAGPARNTYQVLASTNLVDWGLIATVVLDSVGRFELVDNTAGLANRSYRLRQTSAIPIAAITSLEIGAPGQVSLKGSGPAGNSYQILTSTNLEDWEVVGKITIGSTGNFQFIDTAAVGAIGRQYRLRQTVR